MDILPHQAMHLLALGQEERVMRSQMLWMCAGCYGCASRCPNDIDITGVWDDLREKAVAAGVTCPKPEALMFHQAFLKDVSRRGRVHEPRMMGEFNLKTRRPFHNASLGPKMFFKGRLNLLPPKRVRGFKRWMKKVWRG